MAKVSSETHRLVQVKVEFTEGFKQLQQVMSRFTKYDAQFWKEYYERGTDNGRDWGYKSAEFIAYIPNTNYKAFALSMSKLQGPEISYNPVYSF